MEKASTGESSVIRYRIVHHVPGRIRVEVPSIKGLSLRVLERLATISVPRGIEDIRPNPLTGSLVITYDPGQINIVTYLRDMASSDEIKNVLCKGGPDEGYR
jgi:hypothetical protein